MLDDRMIYLLNKYSNGHGKLVTQMYETMQSPEILIPVLGLQGVGKSTLLNAILKENVMPNEADETTCIPVEVRYSKIESVDVNFQDGTSKGIKSSKVSEYVDNNFNPGNEKLVKNIVIKREIELLKNGIVLVDLPGVGSMTLNNQKITQNYISKLYTAIFVIRVNPPITRTEAMFIKLTWKSLCNAWFIMNKWNDESEREVKEGVEANQVILNDIANQNDMIYEGAITTVNAYGALVGVLQNKPEFYEQSNVEEIVGKLNNIDDHWKSEVQFNFNKRVLTMLDQAKRKIQDELENIDLSHEKLENKLKKHESDFYNNTQKIKKIVDDVKSDIKYQQSEFRVFLNKLIDTAEENIRINVFKVIDSGVLDGESLNEVFKDYQVQEFSIVNEEYINFIEKKMRLIEDKIEELKEIIDLETKMSFDAFEFNKEQQFKWEKGVEAGVKIGGSVAGLFIGFAIGGPFGLAAAVGVSIFSSIVASKGKEFVTKDRASKTKREMRPVIEELCNSLKVQIRKANSDMSENLIKNLEDYHDSRISSLNEMRIKNELLLKNEGKNIEDKHILHEDLEYLIQQEVKFETRSN